MTVWEVRIVEVVAMLPGVGHAVRVVERYEPDPYDRDREDRD